MPSTSADTLLAPAISGSLEQIIDNLQSRLRVLPTDWQSFASLGLAYVQQARVTADPSYYPKAQGVLQRSLGLERNDNFAAMVGMAALAAARHDFAGALRWGEEAKAINPYNGNVYGVIGDAQVELGRYQDAFATFQKMVDTLPGVASYARVSYARELMGDVPGAIKAMEAARDIAGTPADSAWADYQLGELYFSQGNLDDAHASYARGVATDADYVPPFAGLAKVAWARGHLRKAIARYTDVVARYPSPEYVIALGDLYTSAGQNDQAEQQYALVHVEERLFRANGVNIDLELALFDAAHGDPARALDGRSRRVGQTAQRARGGRVRLGALRRWEIRPSGRLRPQGHGARVPQRLVRVPRRDDPGEVGGPNAGATPAHGGARHQPALLDPVRARREGDAREVGGRGMRRTARRPLMLFALVMLAVLWPAAAASAHPLGNFTVNLYSGIHVVPGEIRIDYVVDMAEIPTFQEKPSIDTDGDGTMSAAELSAWAAGEAPALAENLVLSVDGRTVSLQRSLGRGAPARRPRGVADPSVRRGVRGPRRSEGAHRLQRPQRRGHDRLARDHRRR